MSPPTFAPGQKRAPAESRASRDVGAASGASARSREVDGSPRQRAQRARLQRLMGPAVVQLYADLHERYRGKAIPGLTDREKQRWLSRFTTLQEILNDEPLVDAYLLRLTQKMIRDGTSLDQVLTEAEAGTWSGDRPVFTDFVPPGVFLALVRGGHLFVDLVGRSHGVHTHRIQWYVAGQIMGKAQALELYQEAAEPRWRDEGKYMWDLVVDALGAAAGDFTQPDRLHQHLRQGLAETPWLSKLSEAAQEEHAAHPETKAAMIRTYPREEEHTPALRNAVEPHQRALDADDKGASALVVAQGIENEVVDTEDDEGRWRWTGWIPRQTSQRPDEATTYFVPTVRLPRP